MDLVPGARQPPDDREGEGHPGAGHEDLHGPRLRGLRGDLLPVHPSRRVHGPRARTSTPRTTFCRPFATFAGKRARVVPKRSRRRKVGSTREPRSWPTGQSHRPDARPRHLSRATRLGAGSPSRRVRHVAGRPRARGGRHRRVHRRRPPPDAAAGVGQRGLQRPHRPAPGRDRGRQLPDAAVGRHRLRRDGATCCSELREGESPVVELKHRRRRHGGTSRISLSPVTDADGVLTHLIGVHEGAGTAADAQPAPAVMNHDPLTGLPNRVVLRDRLGQALGRLRRRERHRRRAVPGRGRLQADQRPLRARRGRRVPARGAPAAAFRAARRRHRGPPGRRRVRDPAGGLRRRGRRPPGGRARAPGLREALHARRRDAGAPGLDGHRGDRDRRRERRPDADQRRRGHVPRQARRRRRPGGVRHHPARPRERAPGAGARPARRHRHRPALAALPADRGPGHQARDLGRGAGALGPPHPRPGRPRRVRAPGRGDRDHRGAGPLGPGARLHRVRRRPGRGRRPPDRAGREPLAAPAGRPGPARAAARRHGPHRPGPAAAWRWRSPRPR